MASIRADLLTCIDDTTKPIHDPSVTPSWALRNEHTLRYTSHQDGYKVDWVCNTGKLLQHTSDSPITASTLTRFCDITTHDTIPALCTASGTILSITTTTLFTTSLSKFTDFLITRLFPVHEGLVIELFTTDGYAYYFLSHPLHEPQPIAVPPSHKAVFITPDLPLIVTIQGSKVYLWRTEITHETNQPTPEPPPEFHLPKHLSTVSLTLSEILVIDADPEAHVILAHDLRGLPVICIAANSCLTGLSLITKDGQIDRLIPSFKIRDVVTAHPISSIRKQQQCLDILVKSASGQLSLYAGRNRLCSVDIDHIGQFCILDPVGPNFSVCSVDGNLGRRYTLKRCSFVSPLVNDCFSALSFVLESSGASRRLACLYQDLIKARSAVLENKSPQSEWELFENAVLRMGSDPYSNEDHTMGARSRNDASWEFLLSSKYHNKRENTRRLKPRPRSVIDRLHSVRSGSNQNSETLHQIFHALHLLYEDYKLDSHKQNLLRCLVSLPAKIAAKLGVLAFLDHYRKDFPYLFPALPPDSPPAAQVNIPVPSIMETIVDRIEGDTLIRPYPIPSHESESDNEADGNVCATWRKSNPYELSRRVCSYYDTLYSASTRNEAPDRKSHILLSRMTKDGFTKEDLDCLPLGICLPLRDTLFVGRVLPRLSVTMDSLALLNREDMLETDYGHLSSSQRREQYNSETTAMLRLNSFVGHADPLVRPREFQGDKSEGNVHQNADEYNMDDSPHRHRFCDDRRIQEVSRILRSSDETVISPIVTKPTEQSVEFDLAAELKLKLQVLVKKRLAAPVGRGAFTLRTFVPSDPTQPLFIPPLCTSGKLLGQKGARVTLAANDAENIQWGEFHNGVAAGLRIVASSSDGDPEVEHILSRTWIVNHRPDDMPGSPGHAGMLLGCGLGGYLPVLKKTDYYEYLRPRHDLTSIGLILGLASCNIGSMDEKLTKMVCVHIRAFNDAGFAVPDFNVQVNLQTASILGLGLLHKSSVEVAVLQGLMQELMYKPKPGDAIDNREAMALAAGLSIGLVCLEKGSAVHAAESEISDRLLTLANGGLSKSKIPPNGNPSFHSPDIDENGLHGPEPLPESETSRIDEKGKINTDVASPGALLALALVYMKTNDERLMERIQLPSTLYSLDRVKPLHVYLVVLTRALVMWDSISATENWLAESIPSLLHGISPNGEASPMNLHGKVNIPKGLRDEDIDVDGLMQARAFAVTGAWTAIALRYAGTSDTEALAIIKAGCESFEKALRKQEDNNLHIQWVYMTCMCSAALSLSIVAGGSGDLDIFRILRRLRKVSTPSLNKSRYGFHLALHLAIGFLFLGGGCLTFGSSPEAIFGLLCAIYPHFPIEVNDNRYHLQAFRHLYVLSVEPRCLETRDVDTGKSCSVDIELKMQNGNTVGLRAPCIVPDASSIKEVIIASERYMPRSVEINPPTPGQGWFSHISNQVVYVKRRVGHLPHEADPKGSRSIFARTLPYRSSEITLERSAEAVERDLASLYGADPDVLSFDKFYCGSSCDAEDVVKRHKEALQECLVGDKTDALYHFMDIWRIGALLKRGCIDPDSAGSLRVLTAYVGFDKFSERSLLRPSLIASVLRQTNADFG